MTKIIGSTLSLISAETGTETVQLPPATPANGAELESIVTEWAEYNYANSSVWLIPNIMHAIVTGTSTEWIVPIMSYDGPTGERERVTLDVIRA